MKFVRVIKGSSEIILFHILQVSRVCFLIDSKYSQTKIFAIYVLLCYDLQVVDQLVEEVRLLFHAVKEMLVNKSLRLLI